MLAHVSDNRLACFLTQVGLFLRDCLYVARYRPLAVGCRLTYQAATARDKVNHEHCGLA
jgi:hypothetical protein